MPRLPLLGRVAAGSPLLAEENVEDVVAVPESIGRGADFLLDDPRRLDDRGRHPQWRHIFVARQLTESGTSSSRSSATTTPADEATVKTFYREPDGRIRLQPENASLEPIYADHVKDSRQGRGGVPEPAMNSEVTSFARTLDQELLALSRGASLECLACCEFVMRLRGVLACPECRSLLADGQ